MGLWSTQQILAAGDPVSVTPVNANFSAIAAILNGGIETINIADLAVTNGKLGPDAVTTDKVQAGTLMGTDLNASAAIAGTQLASKTVKLDRLATTAGDAIYGGFASVQGSTGSLANGATSVALAAITITPNFDCTALFRSDMCCTIVSAPGATGDAHLDLYIKVGVGGTAVKFGYSMFAAANATAGALASASNQWAYDLTAGTQYTFDARIYNNTGVTNTFNPISVANSLLLFPR